MLAGVLQAEVVDAHVGVLPHHDQMAPGQQLDGIEHRTGIARVAAQIEIAQAVRPELRNGKALAPGRLLGQHVVTAAEQVEVLRHLPPHVEFRLRIVPADESAV